MKQVVVCYAQLLRVPCVLSDCFVHLSASNPTVGLNIVMCS